MRAWWSPLLEPQKRVELAEQVGLLVAELGGAEPVDRIRTRGLADLQHLVADLVDGLVPLDAGPLAVDELHRIFQPPLVVRVLAHRGALGAVRAHVERAVPTRLLADPDAVLDFGDDGAADRAMGADRFDAGGAGGERSGGGGFRLAHAARQRARQDHAAGEQAGARQERAPVEAGAGDRRQGFVSDEWPSRCRWIFFLSMSPSCNRIATCPRLAPGGEILECG